MKYKPSVQSLDWTARRRECPRTGRTVVDGGRLPRRHQNSAFCLGDLSAAGMHCRRSSRPRSRHDRGGLVVVDVQRFGRRRFRNIFMHLVLAHDILPNNTSAIRPIQAPSVRQLGRGRAPSSRITDGTDYLSTSVQSSNETTKIPSGLDYAEHCSAPTSSAYTVSLLPAPSALGGLTPKPRSLHLPRPSPAVPRL